VPPLSVDVRRAVAEAAFTGVLSVYRCLVGLLKLLMPIICCWRWVWVLPLCGECREASTFSLHSSRQAVTSAAGPSLLSCSPVLALRLVLSSMQRVENSKSAASEASRARLWRAAVVGPRWACHADSGALLG
jgi:hypothetical protein